MDLVVAKYRAKYKVIISHETESAARLFKRCLAQFPISLLDREKLRMTKNEENLTDHPVLLNL